MNEYLYDSSLGSKEGNVEELAVTPGVNVHFLAAILEGVLEEPQLS